ncbi:MAG: hypothetical protein V2A70_09280 [Candidatus Omnitrophota bacterium]
MFSLFLEHSHLAAKARKELQQCVRIVGAGRIMSGERRALYTLMQAVAGGAMMW